MRRLTAMALFASVLLAGCSTEAPTGGAGADATTPDWSDDVRAYVTWKGQQVLAARSAIYDRLLPEEQAAIDELRDIVESDGGVDAHEIEHLQELLAILACDDQAGTSAGVGDSITLAAHAPGEKVRATVTRVIDPAATQGASSRLVAVDLLLENTGRAVYEDWALDAGASLRDDDGESAGTNPVETSSCRPIGPSVRIATGDKLAGCLLFEVDYGQVPCKVQLTLDSGYGPEMGEWTLNPR